MSSVRLPGAGWFALPSPEAVVSAYRTVLGGDGDLGKVLTDDVVWRVHGMGALDGDYYSRDGVGAFVLQLRNLSEGTLHVELEAEAFVTKQGDRRTTVLHQRVAARRGGEMFEGSARVEVSSVRGGRIREASIRGEDTGSDNAFWSQGTAVLTPADAAILASAIRHAQEPPRPNSGHIVRTIVFTLIAGVGLGFSYRVLTRSRPAVHLDMPSVQLGDQGGMSLMAAKRGVAWRVSTARASGLAVTGPGPGDVEIDIPVARGRCSDVARRLGAGAVSCAQGVIELQPPITVRWNSPQFLSASENGAPYASTALDVSVGQPATVHGQAATDLTFVADNTAGTVGWCFSAPTSESKIDIVHGDGIASEVFSGVGSAGRCGENTRLLVRAQKPDASVPVSPATSGLAVTVTTPQSLNMDASGPALTVRGTGATLNLRPGGTHVVSRTSETSIKGDLTSFLVVQAGRPSINTTGRTTSVIGEKGQLVPSYWERNSWWLIPTFLTLLGTFVVTPLVSTVHDVGRWLRSRR